MAKPEWGAKHVCESCGLKYYDMRRKPVACPGCGEKAAVAAVRSRRSRNAVKPEQEKAPPAVGAPAADPGLGAEDDKLAAGAGDGADVGVLTDDDDIAAEEIIGGGIVTDDKET